MKEFQPLENKYRSEQVAERIIGMIASGELKPGDKLPSEPEFARQLHISRGILREGLAQLKAQGIISRKPKDGTYILPQQSDSTGLMTDKVLRAIEASSYRNIMEMREAIEQKAVTLAIERASTEELEELREIAAGNADAVPGEDVDYYFHYRLVELSQNSIFMSIVDTYFDEIRTIRDRNLNDRNRREEMCREHMAIVEAMCRRDKNAAANALSHHMERVWNQWRIQL